MRRFAWLLAAAASAARAGTGADGWQQPLTAQPGDPARGRAIVVNRQVGLCLLCHSGPFPEERLQGTVSTHLGGAGSRWSVPQLRQRVADSRSLNPASLMPSFHRIEPGTEELRRVGRAWRGQPILSAQQVEDVVAYLTMLRE
jgi:L-cysteine S-thiosulfotransferase